MTMDLGERRVRRYTCPCCNAPIERLWNFVHRDSDVYAAYFANPTVNVHLYGPAD